MRIAVVTTSYPSHAQDPCGHFVRHEAVQRALDGHEVHVIAPAPDEPCSVSDGDGLCEWRLAHDGAFGWPGAAERLRRHPLRAGGAALFMARAIETLRRLRPAHVVAHWIVPSAWPISTAVSATSSVEVVAHGADVRLLQAMPSVPRRLLVRHVLQRASCLRVVSESLLDVLRQALGPGERRLLDAKAIVRAVSIDMSCTQGRAQARRAACNERVMAAVVGRLIGSKRVELAIEAAKLMRGSMHLHVVGDGPSERHLRQMARGCSVSFHGRVGRGEALDWIAASDVLIHPSRAEGAPTVVREARALGTPVIACDVGELRAWARGDRGIVLVEPSAAAIARGIGELHLA